MKSVLRYPGGKSKAIEQILPMLPESFKEYREPFVGGGSVYLAVKELNIAQKYWISDKYKPLINFYKECLNPEGMVNWLTEIQKESVEVKHSYYKDLKGDKSGKVFFFNNRVTFSGTTEAGGFSKQAAEKRFTKSSIDRIKGLTKALEGTKITCLDYRNLIDTPGEDVFLFLDPPYFKAKKLYGNRGELHTFDPSKLASLLQGTSHKFLLTYDDCPEIRELYKWAKIKEWNQPYSMGKSRKKAGELFIYNYEIKKI